MKINPLKLNKELMTSDLAAFISKDNPAIHSSIDASRTNDLTSWHITEDGQHVRIDWLERPTEELISQTQSLIDAHNGEPTKEEKSIAFAREQSPIVIAALIELIGSELSGMPTEVWATDFIKKAFLDLREARK